MARIQDGGTVAPGHRIRTGTDGKVVLVRSHESVIIAPDSNLEIQPASNGMLTRMFQKLGTSMFKVNKRPNKQFEVKTPYLTAIVNETRFTVSVDGSGGTVDWRIPFSMKSSSR